MKRMRYAEILKMITDKKVDTNNIWIEDDSGVKWFWNNGNFMTGMKEWDREPPLICLTDKYDLVSLYSMSFDVVKMKELLKQPNKLTIEDIIDKFSHKDFNVKLINEKGEQWEFVPFTKSIVNENGESILEFYDENQLSTMDFEEMWTEPSLDKKETKDVIINRLQDISKEIESQLNQLYIYLDMLKNID